jgi:hypothetical protein
MTKIIKEITLKELKDQQALGEREIDIAEFTLKLQSRIIVNVSVGMGYSKIDLDYETAEGVQRMNLAEFLDKLIIDSVHRMFAAHNLLFPSFIWAIYAPRDFRYRRNI